MRWSHWVCTENVRVEDDGSKTIIGNILKRRVSRIHRTDIPHRCLMVSRFSIDYPYLPFKGDWHEWTPEEREMLELILKSTYMEYLDDLPSEQFLQFFYPKLLHLI